MTNTPLPVARPYLPSRDRLNRYLDGIYERQWLTNNGALVQELTRRLQDYLGVPHLLLVSNGTLALQIAYRALGVSGSGQAAEAVTTPFTFAATAGSLQWEGLQPVFADIDPATWCLDPATMETAITAQTRALVPVHVFGNACAVEAVAAIAERHRLPVIYDAAHAFGVDYRGSSLLNQGDASILSFHATKLFHTGEGGAIAFRRREDLERARLLINFGITGPESIEAVGINAKMNELQAAMGLAVLDEMAANRAGRAAAWQAYEAALKDHFPLQQRQNGASNNHAYFPVLLNDEAQVRRVMAALQQAGFLSRRYFYPSLDTLACYPQRHPAPVSRQVASRILCLPIFCGLEARQCRQISRVLLDAA